MPPRPCEADRDAIGLEHRQNDAELARILIEDLAPCLALLLQGLERGHRPSVRSWMMIEAEIYGMMFSAKIAMR